MNYSLIAGKSWQPIFKELVPYVEPIIEFIDKLDCKVYPESNVFRAFKECPLDTCQVVIVGQDPYPNGEATGLAFDVADNYEQTPSAEIISFAIERELAEGAFDIDENKKFDYLPPRGVLLLNYALTVQEGIAGSHHNVWMNFTKTLVYHLSNYKNLKWMLWGNVAQTLKPYIDQRSLILETCHPVYEHRIGKRIFDPQFSKVPEINWLPPIRKEWE